MSQKYQSLIAYNEPQSIVSERYKMFRINLSYVNIDKENKVILFTSCSSEEGKTTSIANTAISFAMAGQKVLLIEGDLRKGRIHELFNIKQIPGLTNIIADKKKLEDVVKTVEGIPNLHLLTSGHLPPDPSEILSSQSFNKLIDESRADYDIILIDAPPILSVVDTTIISHQADGVILIIALNETKKEFVHKAKKALENNGANILGVLVTKAKKVDKKSNYYYKSDAKKIFGKE